MALSAEAKRRIAVALGDQDNATELINNQPEVKLASVAAIGSTTNLIGVNGTGSNAAPLVETEARLDVIEAKIDALIAALKA